MTRPPLSVVIPIRDGLDDAGRTLEALLPQARRTGTEVLLVGRVHGDAPDPARVVRIEDRDIFRLRLVGIQESRGDIVAIGEDHAVPREDWCEAVIRAHRESPDVPAIAGCLVNATDGTVSGRGNFLAFAAPFQPPMPELPPLRPPPVSALSVKREVLARLDGRLGHFETTLVPRLSADGEMVADDRIRIDHYQDRGFAWAVANGFHGARAAYGYLRGELSPAERRYHAWWSIVNWPQRILRDARRACREPGNRRELAVVVLIGVGMGVGGAVGAIAGPGCSPARVA